MNLRGSTRFVSFEWKRRSIDKACDGSFTFVTRPTKSLRDPAAEVKTKTHFLSRNSDTVYFSNDSGDGGLF